MSVGLMSCVSAGFPLQYVSACNYGATVTGSPKITTVNTTIMLTRHPFVIGSGDVSSIVLNFYAWALISGSGPTPCGNGYTVNSCAIEYNGTSAPVTFGGNRNLSVASGATDVLSDPVLPGALGVVSFAQGTQGYVRLMVTFSAAQTDVYPKGNYPRITGTQLLYDPAKTTITNGVDSTGALTYTMTGGGVDGTDAKSVGSFFTPLVMGTFTRTGRLPTFFFIGDSITLGANDAFANNGFASGYSRFMFPNGATSLTGAIANVNWGGTGGLGNDWAKATPALLLPYIKYAKYAVENYGTNSKTVSYSTDIFAQLRANNIQKIFRLSLTPLCTSTDAWLTVANQTINATYGPGSAAATFDSAFSSAVASDLEYLDPLGERDTNYWKWAADGVTTSAYSTPDGTHPTPNGYELMATGTTNITTIGGTTTGTLRAYFAAQT